MNEPLTLQELVRMNGQQVWDGEPFNDWVKLIIARYEDADSPMMRIRPGDTVWLSQMFYTRPKKPLPVTVDAIRIDREGVMFITGRRRFSEEAIGKTVFLSKEEAEKALQEIEAHAD